MSSTRDFKAHTHAVKCPLDYGGPSGNLVWGNEPKKGYQTYPTESTGGKETRPRNIALKYCIKVNH